MEYYDLGLLFILGAIFGSFANVVIYRIPNKLSILSPGSFCVKCQTKLNWYENIPLISYVIQLGNCRHCGQHFSLRYVFVEFFTGILFVLIYIYAINILHFIFLAFILVMFMCLILIDIEHYILPDKLLVITSVVSLTYYIYVEKSEVIYYIISALVILAVLLTLKYGSFFIFKQESFGLGDVKLGALIGFILGWKSALIAIFFGFLLAGFTILVLAIFKKIQRKSYIPFGPFMIGGMITYLFFGNSIIGWYLSIILTH